MNVKIHTILPSHHWDGIRALHHQEFRGMYPANRDYGQRVQYLRRLVAQKNGIVAVDGERVVGVGLFKPYAHHGAHRRKDMLSGFDTVQTIQHMIASGSTYIDGNRTLSALFGQLRATREQFVPDHPLMDTHLQLYPYAHPLTTAAPYQPHPADAYLTMLLVAPMYRGYGIATALYRQRLAMIRAHGAQAIVADCRHDALHIPFPNGTCMFRGGEALQLRHADSSPLYAACLQASPIIRLAHHCGLRPLRYAWPLYTDGFGAFTMAASVDMLVPAPSEHGSTISTTRENE